MKKFLQFSVGAFLLMSGAALFMLSVQPAYGVRDGIANAADDSSGGLHIVYVNIDTINAHFIPYIELSESAGNDLQQKLDEYQRNAEELQNRYAKLQEQVNMGIISASAAEREEAAINAGLDALKQQEADLAVIEQKAMAANDSISEQIAVYFDDYAKKHNVDYVLLYGTGMPIIYANDRFDITAGVLAEMNAPYLKQSQDNKRDSLPKGAKQR